MTPTEPHSSPGPGNVALRVIAGLIGATALVVFLAAVWLVLGSRLGPPERDMHGYGLIIGTALAIPAGVLAAVVLPLAFRGRRRVIAYRVGAIALVVSIVGLVVSLVTA